LFQVADVEHSGIPTVSLIYGDQDECFTQAGLMSGAPNLRRVHVSRTMQGPEDVERFLPEVFEALTRPLTDEEKIGYVHTINQERILFEGTLEEAEEFYNQTEWIDILGAPIAKYTTGLPIVIPTEERVEKMLVGTSHKPDELIVRHKEHTQFLFQNFTDRPTEVKGTPVTFKPVKRTATVEQVAVNAVMSGCKPEYFPIVLAIAEAEGGGSYDGRGGMAICVSGPIAREISMNFGTGMFGPGNPANRSMAHASELMWRNLGNNIPQVTNCGIIGTPLFNVFPENLDALPPGWKGLNEEYDFKKDESIIFTMQVGTGGGVAIHRTVFSPGGYRAFQKSGHGGIARRLGVKGVPGPKNWLGYILPEFWQGTSGGVTFFMLPEMAQHLYEAGFKSKDEVYEWIQKNSYISMKEYRTQSWADVATASWTGIEPSSGKPWKELPEDYMVPMVSDPWENCIIVCGGGEESTHWVGGRSPGMDAVYSIDAWR
jgi:hypothetical protein